VNRRTTHTGGTVFHLDGWEITFHECDGETLEWAKEFAHKLIEPHAPENVLKHDHRSQVELMSVEGVQYIVKKFTLQRTWFWFQLTSTAFPTLGEIAYQNAIELAEAGLPTPKPSLLMQRVEQSMVVESWLVYRFLEGLTASPEDAVQIVDYVRKMHSAGWVHRDPHPANFLITPEGVATIDPIRARKTKSRYLQAYDLVLLTHDLPDATHLYGEDALGLWLPVAEAGHSMVRNYRNIKRGLRRLVGIKGNAGNLKAN